MREPIGCFSRSFVFRNLPWKGGGHLGGHLHARTDRMDLSCLVLQLHLPRRPQDWMTPI